MAKITFGVWTACERQHELALWPGDPRSAFDEPVAQGADTLERPEAGARRRIVGPPRGGALTGGQSPRPSPEEACT